MNKSNINHPNIQKIIENPEYTKYFEKYKKLLNIKYQSLFPVYDIDNIPVEKYKEISFEGLNRQSDDVILKILLNAKNNSVLLSAFSRIIEKKINLSKILTIEQKISFINKSFKYFLEENNNYYKIEESLSILLNLLIDITLKDYEKMLKIINKEKSLESIINKRLTADEKLEYVEFSMKKIHWFKIILV